MRLTAATPLLVGLGLALAPACAGDDPETSLTLAELRAGCARATACGVRPYARLDACVAHYEKLARGAGLGRLWTRAYRCANGAGGDCDKVRACFGAAGRCDRTYRASCQGARARSCDLQDRRVYVMDCAEAGQTCAVPPGTGFAATCTPGRCDVSTFSRRCRGSQLLTCAAGIQAVRDCAVEGLACVEAKDGARCMGAGVSCADGGAIPRCEGRVALRCANGKVAREDCGARLVARRCAGGRCVASAEACRDVQDRCRGDDLEACVDGAWTRVSCRRLGLGPCLPTGPPANSAACSRPSAAR